MYPSDAGKIGVPAYACYRSCFALENFGRISESIEILTQNARIELNCFVANGKDRRPPFTYLAGPENILDVNLF